jgi:EF-hand domain pair
MISSIGSSPACYGQSQSQGSPASLAQTEEKLFADIDTNGDGSVSKSELTSFLDKSSGAMGATQPSDSTVSSLFASMDSSGDSSISLSEFQGNASSLADQLRSQLAQAASNSSSAVTSASSSSSDGTTGASTSSTTGSHHHHHGAPPAGGGDQGEGSLIAQLLQQYQDTASGTSSTATVSATA